ncbi:MAG: UvrD-helicase domain-containing protein, partial [Oscillospiraceae bacterium]|nr:UvrD-helicase domain-containing protein [Oscillospiraceae bacterium]
MAIDFEKEYVEARKAYIRARFSHLNDRQIDAVMATEGPLLILAGAGSGKTTVLINRIENLLTFGKAGDSDELPAFADEYTLAKLKEGADDAVPYAALDPVDPWRILAITFTNKAAGELKDRLAAKLGPAANDVWACTFHSACVRILRRDAEKLGFSSNFSIYDTADSLSLIKHILKDMDLDEKTFQPRSVMREISVAKDGELGATAYLEQARRMSDLRQIKIGEIYVEYARRLFAANAMDFDDLR